MIVRVNANINKTSKKNNQGTNFGYGEFSVPEFLNACEIDEALGERAIKFMTDWDSLDAMITAYYGVGQDVSRLQKRQASAILDYGIQYLERLRGDRASTAFFALLDLDRQYERKTGRHFKGFVKCGLLQERINYVDAFYTAFDRYMTGTTVCW